MKNMDRKVLLGANIRAKREEQGISQRKFALMVGTNQTYLWEVETGRVSIGFTLLCKIADGLNVKVGELIDF